MNVLALCWRLLTAACHGAHRYARAVLLRPGLILRHFRKARKGAGPELATAPAEERREGPLPAARRSTRPLRWWWRRLACAPGGVALALGQRVTGAWESFWDVLEADAAATRDRRRFVRLEVESLEGRVLLSSDGVSEFTIGGTCPPFGNSCHFSGIKA